MLNALRKVTSSSSLAQPSCQAWFAVSVAAKAHLYTIAIASDLRRLTPGRPLNLQIPGCHGGGSRAVPSGARVQRPAELTKPRCIRRGTGFDHLVPGKGEAHGASRVRLRRRGRHRCPGELFINRPAAIAKWRLPPRCLAYCSADAFRCCVGLQTGVGRLAWIRCVALATVGPANCPQRRAP